MTYVQAMFSAPGAFWLIVVLVSCSRCCCQFIFSDVIALLEHRFAIESPDDIVVHRWHLRFFDSCEQLLQSLCAMLVPHSMVFTAVSYR